MNDKWKFSMLKYTLDKKLAFILQPMMFIIFYTV